MVAVDLQFQRQLPDGPGLNGLDKAGVPAQLQRRQTEKLRPRPEPLGPVDGQQLKIRIGHRGEMVFLHQLREQGRKALQNRPVDSVGQQLFLVCRGVGGRLFGLYRCFQIGGADRKDHPAVARFSHSKMFQFHRRPSLPHKAQHQKQQHDGQHEVKHLGTQHRAVALDVHLFEVLRVII